MFASSTHPQTRPIQLFGPLAHLWFLERYPNVWFFGLGVNLRFFQRQMNRWRLKLSCGNWPLWNPLQDRGLLHGMLPGPLLLSAPDSRTQ